jgi:hypothetical protein
MNPLLKKLLDEVLTEAAARRGASLRRIAQTMLSENPGLAAELAEDYLMERLAEKRQEAVRQRWEAQREARRLQVTEIVQSLCEPPALKVQRMRIGPRRET